MDSGMKQMTSDMQACVQNCQDCHAICVTTMQHCLQMGGEHAEPAHIRLMMDCAQLCHTCEDFMLRGSDFHGWICGVCADVCERCAEDCERIGPGDAMMLACAQLCRNCAESCRNMAM